MTAQSDDDDYEYDEVDNDYEYGEDWDGWVLICSDSGNDYCCKNGAKRDPESRTGSSDDDDGGNLVWVELGGGVQYVVEPVAAEGYERHDFMPWQKRWTWWWQFYHDDDDDVDSINGDDESDEGEKLTEIWRIVQL